MKQWDKDERPTRRSRLRSKPRHAPEPRKPETGEDTEVRRFDFGILTTALDWLQRATATKIAVGLVGVAVMLMGYFNLDSRVADLEGLDERVDRALKTQNQIELDQDELGDFIEREVTQGIREGRKNLAKHVATIVVDRLQEGRRSR